MRVSDKRKTASASEAARCPELPDHKEKCGGKPDSKTTYRHTGKPGEWRRLTYNEMLGRRSEMLKRRIRDMIVRKNKNGLNAQEGHFLQHMIKELHQNEHELEAARK